MASLFKRISASLSSVVARIFGRKPRKPISTRVECIYGPPEMLAERRRQGRGAVSNVSVPVPEPDPEPEDIYGPPDADPEPECLYGPPNDEWDAEQVPQPVSEPEFSRDYACVYGPPSR